MSSNKPALLSAAECEATMAKHSKDYQILRTYPTNNICAIKLKLIEN
jgi:hypothetical protein